MDKNNFSEIYKKYVMTAYSAAMQVVHNEANDSLFSRNAGGAQ